MATRGQSSERDFSIDVWRGLAISAILFLHAYAMVPGIKSTEWYDPYFNNLGLGVHLFFLLSGYLISESWDRCTTGGALEFWVRRIAKIAPLYYLFLVLGIGAFILAALTLHPSQWQDANYGWSALSFWNIGLHLTFLQGVSPRSLHTNVGPGTWSVVNEVYFYALYPFIRKFLVRGLNGAVIFWIAATVLEKLCANWISDYGFSEGYSAFQNYYFLSSLPDFALGMIIYWLHKTGLKSLSAPVLAAAIGTQFLSMNWFLQSHLFENSLFLPALLPLVLLVQWPENMVTRVLQAFGKQTYSLYLLHLFVMTWTGALILRPMSDAGVSLRLLFVINLVIAFPICFWLSNSIFDRIDRYALRLIVGKYLNAARKPVDTTASSPMPAAK